MCFMQLQWSRDHPNAQEFTKYIGQPSPAPGLEHYWQASEQESNIHRQQHCVYVQVTVIEWQVGQAKTQEVVGEKLRDR